MSDLIRRDDVLKDIIEAVKTYYVNGRPLIEEIAEDVIHSAVCNVPSVDAFEVETIKAWLYEIAGNNIGTEKERQFSEFCEELISRLDGLRNFARERRKENVKID